MPDHRQSGRTTRMVSEAVSRVGYGKVIYVVVPTGIRGQVLRQLQMGLDGKPLESVGVVVSHTLPMNFDYRTWTAPGYRDCEFFIDHSILERTFYRFLQEYHRYDS